MLENPNFGPNYYSRLALGIYKIGHDSIRLLKKLIRYDRSHNDNLNYFDLLGSVCKHLKINEIPGQSVLRRCERSSIENSSENNILGLRDEPKSLRTQYQVQNDTHIRKNQKVLKMVMMN